MTQVGLIRLQIADKELPKSRRQQRLEKTAPKNDEYIAPLQENALKRKREQAEQEQDPKLKEFLQIYQAPSKTNVWTNGDVQVNGPAAAVEENVPAATVPEDESDDEYQVIAKKAKTASASTVPASAPAAVADASAAEKTQDKPTQTRDVMEGVEQEGAADPGPVSDVDWLRSRTNRVLDFVEDDEIPAPPAPSQKPTLEQATPRDSHEQHKEPEVNTPLAQVVVEAQDSEVPNSSEVEKIRETGRLYLRNLHFEVTEDEIREHFAKYGSLEEVSYLFFFYRYMRAMMNVKIGTTDASATEVDL